MDKTIYKRVIPQPFIYEVPEGTEYQSIKLANKFIEWASGQCDVVIRKHPEIKKDDTGRTLLVFRVGLMDKFDQRGYGNIYFSNKAWEEFVVVTGDYLQKVEEE